MAKPGSVKDDAVIKVLVDPTYKTLTAQAAALGISPPALCKRLKKNPELVEEARLIVRQVVKGNLASIYRALIDKANDGDTRASRLILEAMGEIKGSEVKIPSRLEIVIDYDTIKGNG